MRVIPGRKSVRLSFEILEDRNAPVNLTTSLGMLSISNSDLLSDQIFQKGSSSINESSNHSFSLTEPAKEITNQEGSLVLIPKNETNIVQSDLFFWKKTGDDKNVELNNLTQAMQQFSNYAVQENNIGQPLDVASASIVIGPGGGGGNPPSYIEQVVDWNFDNDNGSDWASEGIPSVRDYDAGFSLTENDVAPLSLVVGSVYPPITEPLLAKRFEWKLQWTQAGEGVVKFWDSPTKQNQLSSSSAWQFTPDPTPPPNPLPPYSIEGIVPTPFIEGIHLSGFDKDITIDFAVKTEYWDGPTTITYYKQNKATVGPMVRNMWADQIVNPYFSNKETIPPIGNGAAPEVAALVVFKAQYKKAPGSKVGFIQFLTGSKNKLLNDTTGKLLVNGDKYAITLMPQQMQIQNNLGPNYGYPLLDSEIISHPWYEKPVNLTLQDGFTEIKTTDNPGTFSSGEVKEIWFSDDYSMYVVAQQSSMSPNTGQVSYAYAALTRIKWTPEYRFGGYQNPPGYMTTNTSPPIVFNPVQTGNGQKFDKVGPNDIPRVAPSYSNVVHKFQKI